MMGNLPITTIFFSYLNAVRCRSVEQPTNMPSRREKRKLCRFIRRAKRLRSLQDWIQRLQAMVTRTPNTIRTEACAAWDARYGRALMSIPTEVRALITDYVREEKVFQDIWHQPYDGKTSGKKPYFLEVEKNDPWLIAYLPEFHKMSAKSPSDWSVIVFDHMRSNVHAGIEWSISYSARTYLDATIKKTSESLLNLLWHKPPDPEKATIGTVTYPLMIKISPAASNMIHCIIRDHAETRSIPISLDPRWVNQDGKLNCYRRGLTFHLVEYYGNET
jgi:hypothetical protein